MTEGEYCVGDRLGMRRVRGKLGLANAIDATETFAPQFIFSTIVS
jgi:hypothetical protein